MFPAKLSCYYFLLTTLSEASSVRLKANAADFIKVGFKTLTRRGEERKDYSRIEIEAQPALMVHDASSVDKKKITIEIKSGDESWRALDTPPTMRGGLYKWTESGVEPCVNHRVRIWLRGHDGTSQSFDVPRIISAVTLNKITASGYRPHRPELLNITEISSNSFEVEWSPVQCALSYDVTYQRVSGGTAASGQVLASTGNTFGVMEGLDPCSEYEIRVSAVIGDEYSEENILTFSTLPDIKSAENLDPIIKPEINSVLARWRGFEKLSCISEYLVSVCKSDEQCSEGESIKRDDSLQFIEFRSPPNLEECSEYVLNIKPVHRDVELERKVVNFRTHSQPVFLVTKVHAEVTEEQMIAVTWNNIKCANHFDIFQKLNKPGEEWEKVGTTLDNVHKLKGVACREYKYGVKVFMNDQESEMTESDERVTLPPILNHLAQPTLVVHEKTNNSVTLSVNTHDMNTMCNKACQKSKKFKNNSLTLRFLCGCEFVSKQKKRN